MVLAAENPKEDLELKPGPRPAGGYFMVDEPP